MNGPTVPMVCPGCGAPNTGHTKTTGPDDPGAPQPGDVSVCLYCATVGVYTAQGVEPAPQDIMDHPDVQVAVALVRHDLQRRKADLS